VVEFFAVVFAADQLGDQVVGQRAAPASDHVLEVVVEGLKGVEDAGLVGGEIPVKDLLRNSDLPRVGIVKLFENTCGSVDVSGLCGGT
jgi:hypothetical protein